MDFNSADDIHDRGSTTEPNTPAPVPPDEHTTKPSAPEEPDGDFARLVPQNRSARIAMSQVINAIQNIENEPNANKSSSQRLQLLHSRKFIHIGLQAPLDPVSFDQSSSDIDLDRGSPPRPQIIETGYYRFSMTVPPDNPNLGWVAGRGRDDKIIDFLLCPQAQKSLGVYGRHARFNHHRTSPSFLIYSDGRRILLDGKEEILNETRAIINSVTGISIGELTYKLEFTNLNEATFAAQIAEWRRARQEKYSPPSLCSPTPSTADQYIGNYCIKHIIAKGSTCIVSYAIDRRGGDAVAIKRMNRDKNNRGRIQEEENILRVLKPHPRVCRLVEAISTGGRVPGTIMDEMHLVFSPVAKNHLASFISSSDLGNADRVMILRQCLEAVTHIHSHSLVHRDIKPANIGVVSLLPPKIVLLDFGCATFDPESFDHTVGTIPYLAPEVISLKRNDVHSRPYSRAVDIWSLGITAYQLIVRSTTVPWQQIDHGSYVNAKQELTVIENDILELEAVAELIKEMLQWSHKDRITAQLAVEHKAFSPSIEDISQSLTPENFKRVRKE